jgi:hypothetical protein
MMTTHEQRPRNTATLNASNSSHRASVDTTTIQKGVVLEMVGN